MRFFLTLVAVSIAVTRADAHALSLECKTKGDVVEVDAYYDDDTPCRQGKVRVEDESKALVAEGKTDDTGRWSFAKPKVGRYFISINDGAGHLAKLKFSIAAESTTSDLERVDPKHEVSSGPTREEFTSFPWKGLGMGLGTIAALAIVVRFLLRRS